MTADRTLANRANARASTGPKTVQGRARAAQNARRHGLTVSVLADPRRAADVETLAQTLVASQAGARAGALPAELLSTARHVAEAQLDLARIRQVRHAVLEAGSVVSRLPELGAIDRYERRALSRRKFAIRDFDRVRTLA